MVVLKMRTKRHIIIDKEGFVRMKNLIIQVQSKEKRLKRVVQMFEFDNEKDGFMIKETKSGYLRDQR